MSVLDPAFMDPMPTWEKWFFIGLFLYSLVPASFALMALYQLIT